MSKRLQVLFEEEELEEIRRSAEQREMTVSDWVREALREARLQGPARSKSAKLDAIRAASRHAFPTGDIEQMIAEIERGYSGAR